MKIFVILKDSFSKLSLNLLSLLGILGLGLCIDDILMGTFQDLLYSPKGAPSWIWLIAIAAIINNFLYPLLAIYLVISLSLADRLLKLSDLKYLLIESLRVWGQSFIWGFLLIIPGFYKFMSFLFVPFIVLSDSRYSQGQVDALRESAKLVKKNFFNVVLVYFGYLILSGAFSLWIKPLDEALWQNPFHLLLLSSLESFLLVGYLSILFMRYQRSKNEQSIVSVV